MICRGSDGRLTLLTKGPCLRWSVAVGSAAEDGSPGEASFAGARKRRAGGDQD
jgi:hypothetical protein